jgi:glycosyltransferase involved in cell wall biosynthesis
MTLRTYTISVVIPLYNREKYIHRAIESVCAQTFADFELVVVNDGSTDNGPAIVGEVRDPRIRLIDQENQGVSGARNRGIKEARGELIAFLDADDEWLPDYLDTIVGLANRFPTAGAYCTGWRWIRAERPYLYQDMTIMGDAVQNGCYFDLIRRGGVVHTSALAVRRSVFEVVPPFRVGQHLHQDIDMWFRIGLRYDFAYSARVCSLYHSYIADNATHTRIWGEYCPLYMSLLEMRKDSVIAPGVLIKAEQYAKRALSGWIAMVLLRGTAQLVKKRLVEYRCAFGVDRAYVQLRLLSMMPVPLRRTAIAGHEWLKGVLLQTPRLQRMPVDPRQVVG